jgi:hypothetical protein
MQTPTPLQQVIAILEKKGYSPEQIAEMCTSLTRETFAYLYTEAMTVFTDEDMEKIEQTSNEDETSKLILQLYRERTGKDPYEELNKLLDTYCKSFIAQQELI